jgi:hypothetical protein
MSPTKPAPTLDPVGFTPATPGPWHASRKRLFVNDINNRIVALVEQRAEQCANALVLAAAQDMLAALQAVEPLMIPGMNWTDETGQLVLRMVRAAIRKATEG